MDLTLEEVVVLAAVRKDSNKSTTERASSVLRSTKFSQIAAYPVLVELKERGMVEQEFGRNYITRRGVAALKAAVDALERVQAAVQIQVGDL